MLNETPTASDARLLNAAERLVQQALKAGATAADAVAGRSASVGVSVRNGKVEASDNSESDGFSLRVFVGQRVASISANATADAVALAERAVAMAKASPEDASQGLADPEDLARDILDLDLYDPTEPGADRLREMALEAEAAALAVKGITNSSGASAGAGSSGMVLVTSGGFSGTYRRSGFSVSASVIAGEGTGMERDYDYSSKLHFSDLEDAAIVGRRAGERAVRRLSPAKAQTGTATIVFDPRVARSLAGHLAGAINGIAVARKSTFLRDKLGQRILPAGFRVTDNPLVPRRGGSRPFDGEGVRGQPLDIVVDGVLQTWLLSSSAARELGLKTNGRGARGGSGVGPTSTNFAFEPGTLAPAELITGIGSGIYVTEVFGQGVNMITGQYSRGASGFLIENGEIAGPVSEFTIASDLNHMFAHLVVANDLDRNYSTAAPTIAIEGMTIAGAAQN
jgi:PmbA protein